MTIDATKKACPIPFMLAKEQIDAGQRDFIVMVDNKAAVQNLKRLATSQACTTTVEDADGTFKVRFVRQGEDVTPQEISETTAEEKNATGEQSILVFIGKDTMGDGSAELGRNLVRMFLYTLEKDEHLIDHIVLMNSGVKLAVEDQQCITALSAMVEKGVDVTVCGTCLDYYHLLDDLKVGTVGNMYDITQKFLHAGKVISI